MTGRVAVVLPWRRPFRRAAAAAALAAETAQAALDVAAKAAEAAAERLADLAGRAGPDTVVWMARCPSCGHGDAVWRAFPVVGRAPEYTVWCPAEDAGIRA